MNTLSSLLNELARLTHDGRMRRMVELGRSARTDRQAAATIARLEQEGFYERMLALQSCYGSGDGAHVLRAVADSSEGIRRLAIQLAALVCDDEQVQAVLALLPPAQQRQLLVRLLKRRRSTPIDAFLAGQGDAQLAGLVAYGSPAVAERLAERALVYAGADQWRRLARHQPELVAARLLRQAGATDRFDQRLRWLANAVLPVLAERAPDRAVELVQALAPHIGLGQLDLRRLALRRPAAIADLLLGSDSVAQVDLVRLARRLDHERLRALLRRGLIRVGNWLLRLAPEARRVAYEVAGVGSRNEDGVLLVAVVASLPGELRIAEARRHLALPALATRPAWRLPYAALLPWDEARATLDPFVHNPDPELRSIALPALVAAGRYQREHLPDILALVRARRNEQDPVRLTMLGALAQLPPSRWQVEHLADLGQIVRDTLDAADCSVATAYATEQLLLRLLPFHPEWSAGWLATMVRERGSFSTYTMDDWISEADMRRAVPALLPVLQGWEPREREDAVFRAASLFGRRLAAFPELADMLERLTRDRRDWVASNALNTLAQYQRHRLPALIPALLRDDPSWITQTPVVEYLHRRRQDLLTPLLGQTAFKGRFSTGKTRFVLPLFDGFWRWTPAQQEVFARVLEQVTHDDERDNPAIFMVINQLAALPAVAPRRVVQLAGLDNQRVAVRDVALRALARLDAGQGVPTLLEALDDERARVAIYALRRAVLQMPAARALELLRGVPMTRVTVAKQVVRLMGELAGDTAYADLMALEGQDLQRDVRVALLRALWDHLDKPATWPVLERAAAASDPAIAAGVIRIPAERQSPPALERLAGLLAILLEHPDPQVRLKTLQRCASMPIDDRGRTLLRPLLAALDTTLPDQAAAAASAVFGTYAGRDASLVGEAVRHLGPNRQALLVLVQSLHGALRWNRAHLLPTARAALVALEDDRLATLLRVELAAAALPWDEVATLVRQLADTGLLHAEALMATVAAVQAGAQRADAPGLEQFEAALAASDDPRQRRIALAALVGQAQGPDGWSVGRRERLERYRADAAPLVAGAAQFIFPPPAPAD